MNLLSGMIDYILLKMNIFVQWVHLFSEDEITPIAIQVPEKEKQEIKPEPKTE